MRAFLPVIIAALASSLHAQPADLVLRNGKIVTMNPPRPPRRPSRSAATRSPRSAPTAPPQQWIGPKTKVIDLHGMLAIPGFIEGHGHFTGVGEFRMGLDLREARTWDEIVAQVARAVKQAKPGEWIVGRGWHQSKWDRRARRRTSKAFPLHDSLDKVSPNNPVLLTHASGHATFVNGKALELAGVTGADAQSPGGEILKDAKGSAHRPAPRTRAGRGQPRARRLRSQAHRRRPPRRNSTRPSRLAIDESLSKGITTFRGCRLAVLHRRRPQEDGRQRTNSACASG